uniref:Glycerophosphodiester phosphodiesterase domain-containing protein 1-like n=1 Tax=Phallusia mammillata TaxID=59560 RepID=A0A6F9DCV9_9ASCI|nr:glycerophosphodiester phosphodiesterase domain-containing protein 1-like [Phallusia mammillata]
MSLSAGATAGYAILGSFGAYALTSIVLLNFPTILHRKKKRNFYCSHISHRGGAAERLENTMSAFKNAVESGCQMIELDVHLTKDKVVVVSHDENLKRCCDMDEKISDLNFKELPKLKDTLQAVFYNNQTCHNFGEKQHIPSLEEVFEQFPETPINVDVKDDDNVLIAETDKLIKKYKRENLTVWCNFRDVVVDKLQKFNPEVPVAFSMKRVALLYVWFYTGLLPFIPLKESFLEIPHPNCLNRINFALTANQKRLVSIGSYFARSRILINHLKARGIPTYFWVLNEEEDFKAAFELGAEGVMTDCPTKLSAWLDENPQYWIGRRNENEID